MGMTSTFGLCGTENFEQAKPAYPRRQPEQHPVFRDKPVGFRIACEFEKLLIGGVMTAWQAL